MYKYLLCIALLAIISCPIVDTIYYPTRQSTTTYVKRSPHAHPATPKAPVIAAATLPSNIEQHIRARSIPAWGAPPVRDTLFRGHEVSLPFGPPIGTEWVLPGSWSLSSTLAEDAPAFRKGRHERTWERIQHELYQLHTAENMSVINKVYRDSLLQPQYTYNQLSRATHRLPDTDSLQVYYTSGSDGRYSFGNFILLDTATQARTVVNAYLKRDHTRWTTEQLFYLDSDYRLLLQEYLCDGQQCERISERVMSLQNR